MPHDIFISHSSKDKLVADAVVAHLERDGLRCWCAPRDILPGTSWANAIIQGIAECKVMVVLFSEHANESNHIRREVERAIGHGLPVVPIRIEAVRPAGDLEYFLSSAHWMDAVTPPMEQHLSGLAQKLRALIDVTKPMPVNAKGSAVVVAPIMRRNWMPAAVAAVIVAAAAGAGWVGYVVHSRSGQSSSAELQRQDPPRTPVQMPPDGGKPVTIPQPNPAGQNPVGSTSAVVAPKPASTTLPVSTAAGVMPSKTSADPSIAQDYEEWQRRTLVHFENNYFRENGPAKFQRWLTAAKSGDAVAQMFVGLCYAEAAGVAEDDTAADDWLTRSANAGNSDAMTLLGNRFVRNPGFGPSEVAAWFNWETQAAKAGNPNGMTALGAGLMGVGDPAKVPEAKQLLERAAAAGLLDAEAIRTWSGLTPINEFQTRMEKCAKGGEPSAMIFIAQQKPRDAERDATIRQAVWSYGTANELRLLIDPPHGFLTTAAETQKMAWERLHELADAGYTEAARTIESLKQSGHADLMGK